MNFILPYVKPSYSEKTLKPLWVPKGNGCSIPCLYYPNETSPYLFLYFHGNSEDLGSVKILMDDLQEILKVFLHGEKDKTIPAQHSKEMYSKSIHPLSEIVIRPFMSHNGFFVEDDLCQPIKEFINKLEKKENCSNEKHLINAFSKI